MFTDLFAGLQDGLALGLSAVALGIGLPLLLLVLVEGIAALRALDRVTRGIPR